MANFKGVGGFKNQPLMASYMDSQVLRDNDGKVTAVYLAMQKFNGGMTQAEAKKGHADAHPYLAPNNIRYSGAQFAALEQAGTAVKVGDINYIGFRGDVTRSRPGKDGKSVLIANIPTNAEKAEKHPLSKLENFTAKTIARHAKNTKIAQSLVEAQAAKQPEKDVEATKAADAELDELADSLPFA